MELKLYNTLTRQKDALRPLAINPATGKPMVRMYVCGPTVYDFAHIGNARPVIVFDVLYRLLRHLYGAENVIYTRNITDVDDKINDRAARDFPGLPLNEAIRRVTEGTNNQFQADVKALGCLTEEDVNIPGQKVVFFQPRATEHIDGMIAIINQLLAKGFAYVAEGAEGREVLFSVGAMPRYGQLSNRRLDENIAGARVAVEEHKKNPADFVLWKQSGAGQPGWDATFADGGKSVAIYGRPGWHIECSAMSMAKLLEPFGGGLACDDPVKNTFDIHGGGIDLVFPHHENEIAQSCCAFGRPGAPNPLMASIWMHNGFLQVEGQKMSKSLGNFVTMNELLATEKFGGRKWPGEVLRVAMLATHYRQPIDFSTSNLLIAEERLKRWENFAEGRTSKPSSKSLKRFTGLLSDDLNTPALFALLDQIVSDRNANESDRWIVWRVLNLLVGIKAPTDKFARTAAELNRIIELIGKKSRSNMRNVIVSAMKRPTLDVPSKSSKLRPHAEVLASVIAIKEWIDEVVDSTVSVDPDFSARIVRLKEVLRGASPSEKKDVSQVDNLISLRNAARAAKNWAESDRIRKELESMGIQLKDGKDAEGNPVTTWEVKR